MISSLDEFLLLARKWQSESISVVVMTVVRASTQVLATMSITGRIVALSDRRIDVADGHNIAAINLLGAKFSYGIAENIFESEGAANLDECVMVTVDNGGQHAVVAVFSRKQTLAAGS